MVRVRITIWLMNWIWKSSQRQKYKDGFECAKHFLIHSADFLSSVKPCLVVWGPPSAHSWFCTHIVCSESTCLIIRFDIFDLTSNLHSNLMFISSLLLGAVNSQSSWAPLGGQHFLEKKKKKSGRWPGCCIWWFWSKFKRALQCCDCCSGTTEWHFPGSKPIRLQDKRKK